jgi:hypothetical protein
MVFFVFKTQNYSKNIIDLIDLMPRFELAIEIIKLGFGVPGF